MYAFASFLPLSCYSRSASLSILPLRDSSSPHTHRRTPRCRSSRPRPRTSPPVCCATLPDQDPSSTTPDAVRALLTSTAKADQQRGLLLVRNLPTPVALELLLLSVETSKNEFIRASAAIALGQLPLHPSVTLTAVAAMTNLLATDKDYAVRAAAAAGLGYIPRPPADLREGIIESLSRALLEDREWQVHFSCLASLGSLHDARAVPTLLPWLDSDVDLLVQAAVGALGDIADPVVVPNLLDLLGSRDMMTRQRLAHALGAVADAGSKPAIIDALRTLSRDQSFAVRDAATEALQSLGCDDPVKGETMTDEEKLDLEVANLLEGDERGNAGEYASDALRRRLERSFDKEFVGAKTADPVPQENDDDYDTLVNDLRYGESSVQTMAAIKLRRFDGALALKAVQLGDCLNPRKVSERVRSVCVNLLARGSDMEKIIEVLKTDPDQNVRSACCDALMDMGGGDAAISAAIAAFKNDAHWLVKVSAAIALGSIGKGSQDVEATLISSLRKGGLDDVVPPQDSVIRRHVVTALGFLGTEAAVYAFRELVESAADDALRYRVAAALRGIVSQESVQLVLVLIDDENSTVAEMAQGSLDALAQQGLR